MVSRMVCLFFVLAFLAASQGCGGDAPETGEAAEDTSPAGMSASGIESEGVSLKWETAGDSITFTLSAPTTGWVAVGFDGESAMLNSDMVIGYVEGGNVSISDHWGDGYTSHRPDTELGGTPDIVLKEGSELEGVTSITFTRPISPVDEFDSRLLPGTTHRVILAYGPEGADDFTGHHSWVKTFQAEMVPAGQ